MRVVARKLVEADRTVARIAARQHGVVSLAQLRRAGLGWEAIRHRLRRGLLHRVHRAVYAVGHPGLTDLARWKAATLACGDGAVLSHRSAADLWGMLEPAGGEAHVTVPVAGGRAKRSAIRIHRRPDLDPAHTTSRENIPVTRPQRTLIDLRPLLEPGELRAAIRRAELLGLPLDPTALVPDLAWSALELAFLRLCRRHRLPAPEVNARVGPYRVDFLWRRERLIVETDGRRFHRGAIATLDDAERDRRLARRGFEVLRVGYREVVDEPKRTAARVRERLRSRTP